jgi:uncharacterized repeat protein (TIGR01451 family)
VALIGTTGFAFAGSSDKKASPVASHKANTVRANDATDASGTAVTMGGTHSPGSPLAPSNDDCPGAITIPDGPYPLTTTPVNAFDATPQGSDDGGLFPAACNASGTDYTVWYTFTPSVTTAYTFTTCAANGATGNSVLDTVIALFQSSDDTCGGAMTSLACNDSAACASPGDPSTFTVLLNAGQLYYVVAGHWLPDGAIAASNSTYVLNVVRSNAPSNDTCSGAIDLPLNREVTGTTAAAANDYQTPATTACYAGLAGTQRPTTAPGRDVVFTFTAPSAGQYSFRYVSQNPNNDLFSQNPVLYASTSCPGGGGVVNCLQGSNHMDNANLATSTGINNNRGEELECVTLSANQQIFVFLDDGGNNAGGAYGMEATPCYKEVEPNNSLATATPYNTAYCGWQEGNSTAGASFHCVLGVNAGAVCQTTSTTTAGDPPLNCGGAPGLCFADSVCEAGPNAGLACVPKCVNGPTPGATCTASAQCGTGGTCQTSGGCGVCTSGTNSGQPCVNNTNCGTGGICAVGVCGRTTNEGDVDFWTLGSPVSGSKVYAAVAGAGANDYDWRMRITSTTETLGFDDDDDTQLNGSLAPNVSGAKTTGGETFVKLSRSSAFVSEAYRLYAVVEPPIAAAQAESGGEAWDISFGWPGDGLFDDFLNNGANTGYITGTFLSPTDSDCYKALAYEGDDLIWFGDSNPTRVAGTGVNSNPEIIIYDAAGAGISNFVFSTGTSRNIGPFTGNTGLNAITPQSTSFFQHWRATYSGLFDLCFYGFSTALNTNTTPLSYAGALTSNCGPMHPAGPGTTTADVSITKTGDAGPIASSGITSYTITLTNNSGDIAQEAVLDDTLDANLKYLSLTINDGFGGNNTACLSLPSPGTSDAPINCTVFSLAPGASAVFVLTVQVQDCIDSGITISNTASVSTTSTDPNPSNDSASWSFDTVHSDSCTALFCDPNGCIVDQCFHPGTCNAGSCEAPAVNCDDNSLCTDDSCNPSSGCFNDPSPGQQCDDGNACTGDATGHDSCDPLIGCVFAPAPAGSPCNDFFTCTDPDACDGAGNCVGHSVCDDNNPCTDDSGDEFNNCACSNTSNFGPCDDGNACTTGDTCNDQNACVGGAAPDCDDGNACTADSCDPQVGCVHTAITCDDNNACTVDTCDSGTGCVYTDNSAACNDNNACTTDSCNPASGCVNTNNNNPCDDGNACTMGDACGGGSCQAGAPVVCNDNNGCTDDSCNPASGCVYTPNTASCDDGNACTNGDVCGGGTCHSGAPTVCSASDQCHDAGVCNPGSGVCSNPAKPNGTTCDDGNPTTSGDNCQAGVCAGSSCPASPDPKNKGYYKKLCGNGNGGGGDSITDADALCVASISATFSSITTAAQVCNVLQPGGGDQCNKEDDQLMALALNLCKNRLCRSEEIDSNCGSNSKTVGQSFDEMDAIFSSPTRDRFTCNHGGCLGEEINTGRALKINSLSVVFDGGTGKVRLNWTAPTLDDGTNTPSSYTIWSRPMGSTGAFVQIGTTKGLTFLDTNASALNQFQYEIKTVVPIAPIAP